MNDLATLNSFALVFPSEPTLVAISTVNSSTLDFFLPNLPSLFSSAAILFTLNSDHLPVVITANLSYRN